MPKQEHRDTIFLEDAEVLAHETRDEHQFVLRLLAPQCAAHAEPGSFVHVQCDAMLPMRRPLSIMRANAQQGTVELLYKRLGVGLEHLARKKVGARLSL